jgi:hypothetical protein
METKVGFLTYMVVGVERACFLGMYSALVAWLEQLEANHPLSMCYD